MPIPDIAGLPPFAEFRDLETKLSELIQKYNNLLVSLDSLNVVSLTADHIDAGTLNAGIVTVRADYAGGAFIEISANGIRINDGVKDTFVADTAGFITLVGALFRTVATGYPNIEINSLTNLFKAEASANNYISIIPDSAGVPALQFHANGKDALIDLDNIALKIRTPIGDNLGIQFSCEADIYITTLARIIFPSWSKIYSTGNGKTLQQELDSLSARISALENPPPS
ncbi:hypothetical protein JCM16163A_40870 [Paenibacillus sp. YK5]